MKHSTADRQQTLIDLLPYGTASTVAVTRRGSGLQFDTAHQASYSDVLHRAVERGYSVQLLLYRDGLYRLYVRFGTKTR